MRKQSILVKAVLVVGLLLAACAPENTMTDQQPAEEMMEEMPTQAATDGMMEMTAVPVTGDTTPESEMMDDNMMPPAWFSTELTDQSTGDTFQIEDFKGKVVLIETFAQWCPTCLRQQREIARLHEMRGMTDDLESVSLDVDLNEDAPMLLAYLEKHGFDWRFAIAPPETAREIGSLYGQQFLNPPSAPVFIIDRHGEVHPLPFGVKSAEDLQNALKPFLEEGM